MQIATKYPDVFFTPEYSELFKDTAFGGEPCHFNVAGIDYRFYKRPIEGTPYFDIVSPYGYSGPVIMDATVAFLGLVEYTQKLIQYFEEHNIITEFARLHPFINRDIDLFSHSPNTPYHYEHEIFYIDLTKSEDEIWKGFDKGCRSAIKKSIHNGMESRQNQKLDGLARLYDRTMREHGTKQEYFFKSAFWHEFYGIASSFQIIDTEDDIKAAACFLKYGDYCHYFLSASNGDNSGATNLLIWEAVKWAKAQGCKIFNLGGGLKAGDSLESFKRSFSHDSKPFCTYRKIHNQAVYDELSKGIVTDYFPAYRAERTKQ